MREEWQADRKARELAVNWTDQAAMVREYVEALAPGPENDKIRTLIAARESSPDFKEAMASGATNLWAAACQDVQEAMVRFGIGADQFTRVRITGTAGGDVSAQIAQYNDGSALITVADSVGRALKMFCQFTAIAVESVFGRGLFNLWRRLRRVERRGIFDDPETLAEILRYDLIGQRLQGYGGIILMVLDTPTDQICKTLFATAVRFVLAHELAHRALGHAPESTGFGPSAEVSTCSRDQQRELEADRLALKVLLADQRRHFAGTGLNVADMEVVTALGIESALLALHAVEKAVFIRNGHTHPPAEVRGAQIHKAVQPRARRIARVFLPSLRRITDAACTFDDTAQLLDWPRMQTSPYNIATMLPRDRIEYARYLDATQCLSNTELFAKLERSAPTIASGAKLLQAEKVREALQAWNLETTEIETICDSRCALTFYGLIEAIEEGWESALIPEDTRLGASVAAARVVAARLSKSEP